MGERRVRKGEKEKGRGNTGKMKEKGRRGRRNIKGRDNTDPRKLCQI